MQITLICFLTFQKLPVSLLSTQILCSIKIIQSSIFKQPPLMSPLTSEWFFSFWIPSKTLFHKLKNERCAVEKLFMSWKTLLIETNCMHFMRLLIAKGRRATHNLSAMSSRFCWFDFNDRKNLKSWLISRSLCCFLAAFHKLSLLINQWVNATNRLLKWICLDNMLNCGFRVKFSVYAIVFLCKFLMSHVRERTFHIFLSFTHAIIKTRAKKERKNIKHVLYFFSTSLTCNIFLSFLYVTRAFRVTSVHTFFHSLEWNNKEMRAFDTPFKCNWVLFNLFGNSQSKFTFAWRGEMSFKCAFKTFISFNYISKRWINLHCQQ